MTMTVMGWLPANQYKTYHDVLPFDEYEWKSPKTHIDEYINAMYNEVEYILSCNFISDPISEFNLDQYNGSKNEIIAKGNGISIYVAMNKRMYYDIHKPALGHYCIKYDDNTPNIAGNFYNYDDLLEILYSIKEKYIEMDYRFHGSGAPPRKFIDYVMVIPLLMMVPFIILYIYGGMIYEKFFPKIKV